MDVGLYEAWLGNVRGRRTWSCYNYFTTYQAAYKHLWSMWKKSVHDDAPIAIDSMYIFKVDNATGKRVARVYDCLLG